MANSKRLVIGLVLVSDGLLLILLAHWLAPQWFEAKAMGAGFRPATWQGWAVAVAGVVSIVAGSRVLRRR